MALIGIHLSCDQNKGQKVVRMLSLTTTKLEHAALKRPIYLSRQREGYYLYEKSFVFEREKMFAFVCEWSRFSPVRNAIFVKDSTEQIQFQVCVCVFACMYLRVLLRQKREREKAREIEQKKKEGGCGE